MRSSSSWGFCIVSQRSAATLESGARRTRRSTPPGQAGLGSFRGMRLVGHCVEVPSSRTVTQSAVESFHAKLGPNPVDNPEGYIATLKRQHGWGRTRLSHLEGSRTRCGWGVLNHTGSRSLLCLADRRTLHEQPQDRQLGVQARNPERHNDLESPARDTSNHYFRG